MARKVLGKNPLLDSFSPAQINIEGMEKSVVKYFQKREFAVNREAWDWSLEKMKTMFHPESSVLSQDEAMHLIEDFDTSPGMPWRSKVKTKKQMLHDFGVEPISCFWERLEEDELEFLWHITPKDELLPDYKIKAGKTRTIIGIPIEAHVAFLRLCTSFNKAFTRECEWSFVGKNQFQGRWQQLYELFEQGDGVLELDGAAWDSSVLAESLSDICEWRCLYIPEEIDKRRLRQLYSNVIRSNFVLWDGSIVQKEMGLATGFTNTLVDNTLHNIRFALYCLYRHFGKEKIEDALKNFFGRFFGDDSIMAWKGLDLSYEVFRDFGKEIGLDMTCTTGGLVHPLSAVFVGGQFYRREDGRIGYLPSIPKSLCSLQYYRKPHDLEKYFSRLAGIRLNVYGADHLFEAIDKICMEIFDQYKRELERRNKLKIVKTFFISESDLDKIHFGVPTEESMQLARMLLRNLGGSES